MILPDNLIELECDSEVGFNGLALCADTWTKTINFVGYTAYVIDMAVRDFKKKI